MLPFEPTYLHLALVVIAFLVAGTSKGAFGVGIPLIIVLAISGVMHPATTHAVLAFPITLSNLRQAFEGRRFGVKIRRFWPAIPTTILGGIIGAQFIATIDPKSAQTVLGLIVLLYATSQLFSVRIPAPTTRSEKWVTAIIGGF